jgi:hypothetical protein
VHPTELAFLQDLLNRLQYRHVEYTGVVPKKEPPDAVSTGTVNPDTPNVLQAMMKLEQAKARAKTVNKVALEAEKEKDAAEKAVEDLKRHLQPKREHTDDDDADVVPGSMRCVEKKFELQGHKWEEYKGIRYSDGDKTLVVELWLHRVTDDLSGLTFQEWDPSTSSDETSAPVEMIVNSNELLATDFPLVEVRSLQLDVVSHGGRRTLGTVRKVQGVGNSSFVLSVENDNDFRSRRQ